MLKRRCRRHACPSNIGLYARVDNGIFKKHQMDCEMLWSLQSSVNRFETFANLERLTTLRSTKGPYIETGRLTREECREIKCTRALFGIAE
jgi:hypothetical protein